MRGAPDRLRCEYQDNPLGLDCERPRLSWWLNDPRAAELQTAYQIQAASSPAALQAGAADLWDTGYVASRQTVNVIYGGRALTSGTRVWWRVRCYDSDGTPSPWSEAAWFELGLLHDDDWQARWIEAPLTGSPATAVPVPVLWRDFEVDRMPQSARLYLAVLGSAWVELNGRRLTRGEPVEPWYDAARRVPYRVFDATELLRRGRNRLALLLGDGTCCGPVSGGPRQRYGDRPAVCAQLVIHQDGAEPLVLGSDASWSWYPSWMLRGDRDAGEEVDGRQYRSDWSEAGQGPTGNPVSEVRIARERFVQQTGTVTAGQTFEAAAAPRRFRGADGRTRLRYDFGRSVLGRVRVRLSAAAGMTLTVHYGEQPAARRPDVPDEPAPDICWEAAPDRYTCRGDEVEVFEPRFALHAFRYAELILDQEPREGLTVTAVPVSSSLPDAAEFHCDHRLLEQLFAAAARTCRSGLALGPVAAWDPPRRWAACADFPAVLAGAAATLDVAAEFAAWLRGLAALGDAEGMLPVRVPAGPMADDEPREMESLLPCLWFLYRYYGDRRLLEALYPAVQRHLQGLRERWPGLLRGGTGGADHLRQQMLGTASYFYALSLATRMAGVLGRLADLERWEALAVRVCSAFRARFVTGDGLLAGDDQLGYLLALELGMLEGRERVTAMGRLAEQLHEDGFHPRVDLRYGGLLLEALTAEGRSDLAYQVLLQTTPPGWLHPLHGGANILWDTARAQPGRLAAAAVAGWLQRFLLGLELDDNLTPDMNAYRRMRIQPRPPLGAAFPAGPPVRQASGCLDTVHGRYESAWRIGEDGFHLQVRIPGNCSARVVLPDGTEHLVMAGGHEFFLPQGRAAAPSDGDDDIPVLREISGGR